MVIMPNARPVRMVCFLEAYQGAKGERRKEKKRKWHFPTAYRETSLY